MFLKTTKIRVAWGLFRRNSTPASAPEGSKMLEKIRREISERRSELQQLEQREQLALELEQLDKAIAGRKQQLAALVEQIAGGHATVAGAQKQVKQAQHEIDRIELAGGITEETRRLRYVADAAVGLLDDPVGTKAGAYLQRKRLGVIAIGMDARDAGGIPIRIEVAVRIRWRRCRVHRPRMRRTLGADRARAAA